MQAAIGIGILRPQVVVSKLLEMMLMSAVDLVFSGVVAVALVGAFSAGLDAGQLITIVLELLVEWVRIISFTNLTMILMFFMLQMGNIVKNPRIWIAPIVTSAITGPLATCLFGLQMNGTPVSSGMALNLTTEYIFDRFVVYGKTVDTNKRAVQEETGTQPAAGTQQASGTQNVSSDAKENSASEK